MFLLNPQTKIDEVAAMHQQTRRESGIEIRIDCRQIGNQ